MNNNQEILNKLLPSIIEILGDRSDFSLDTSFASLNIDSMKYVELILASEDVFGIEVIDSELEISRYKIIDDFISMIQTAMQRI